MIQAGLVIIAVTLIQFVIIANIEESFGNIVVSPVGIHSEPFIAKFVDANHDIVAEFFGRVFGFAV